MKFTGLISAIRKELNAQLAPIAGRKTIFYTTKTNRLTRVDPNRAEMDLGKV